MYGTYKLTVSAFNEPLIELLYSSENSEECVNFAHFSAEECYRKHSDYSLYMGMIPLKAKWVVYNTVSTELEIFYACRSDKHERN